MEDGVEWWSLVTRAGSFPRVPGFISQHLYSNSSFRGPDGPSAPHRHQACTWCTNIDARKTPIHIKQWSLTFKNRDWISPPAEMKQSLHLLLVLSLMCLQIPTIISFNICFLLQLAQRIEWWTCVLHSHTNHPSQLPALPSSSAPHLRVRRWVKKLLPKKKTTKNSNRTPSNQTQPNPRNLSRETWPISESFYHVVLRG